MKKYINFICKVGYVAFAISALGFIVSAIFQLWLLGCIASLFLGISFMLCLAFMWE